MTAQTPLAIRHTDLVASPPTKGNTPMIVQTPLATRHTDLFASPPTASRPLTRRTALRGIGAAGLAAAGVALAGRLGPAAFATHDPNADPAAVIDAYAVAVNAGNLDAILSCYTDDAIHAALPTPDGSAGVCHGKGQFRMFYEQAIANGDEIELVPESLTVDGERVAFRVRTTSEPWTALGLGALEADSEAIMADGCILTHVVMLTAGAVRQLLVAQGIAADAGEHEHANPAGGPR